MYKVVYDLQRERIREHAIIPQTGAYRTRISPVRDQNPMFRRIVITKNKKK